MGVTLPAPLVLVVVPFACALILAFLGRLARPVAAPVAAVGPLATLAYALAALRPLWSAGGGPEHVAAAFDAGAVPWFRVGDVSLVLAWEIDALAALMLVAVGLVATCVILFSAGYMKGDPGWVRYFALIALFTGSMNLLVVASSFTTLFIGWELVGACSFLLIGFWYRKPAAAAAAIKAFLTTRVGDVGLLVGIAVLWVTTGSDRYSDVLGMAGAIPTDTITIAAVALAIGAIGKSAQFPLHAWLPDAMEGPTPVSALIHAATMVAAGVYLVARVWPLFEAAPTARLVLLAAGTISAFGAALIAVAQSDIKKVLAYSTISQLGFMFAALGAGAWVAAFFHLVTHAGFKALLFLTSGSVIHGTGTQDIREMGGLRTTMPYTFAAWMIGSAALAGVPPFSGFFSKDLIIEAVLHEAPALGVLLIATAGLTALYIARTTRLAFFGTPAAGLHAHESGSSMLIPLAVLSVPAVAAGFLSARFAEMLGHEPEPMVVAVTVAAVAAVVLGAGVGWWAFSSREAESRVAESLGGVWRLLGAAWKWDALVDLVVVRPVRACSRALWAWGDRIVADGVPVGIARLVRSSGGGLSRLQSGDAQSYAAVMVVALVVMLVASVWMGRG